MNRSSFTFYDLLVDIVPGTLFIALAIIAITPTWGSLSPVLNAPLLGGLVLLTIAYATGHFLQAGASMFDKAVIAASGMERSFQNRIETARKGCGSVQETKVLEILDQKTGEELPPDSVFGIVQSHLWSQNIGRLRRFQILYTFFRSLYFLLVLTSVLWLVAGLRANSGYGHALSVKYLIGGSVGQALLSYVAWKRRVKFENVMSNTMITDFYTHYTLNP